MLGRFVFAAATLLAAPLHAQDAGAPPAAEVTQRAVGDWTVICAAEGSPCVMEQAGKNAGDESVIGVQVERLAEPVTVEGKQVEAALVFLTPLRTLLQNGLRLQVDSGPARTFGYFICQQNGCIVQAAVEPELLASFRRGARARLTYAVLAEGRAQQVEGTVSLSGFTRAFDSLRK